MSVETTTEEYYYDDIIEMTPSVQIPSGIGLTLLIIIAILGNVLTIIAYRTDKKLKSIYNFYIFNLAIADLLLACISMPFYAVYTLKEFIWPFGTTFCKIWLVMDFTLCFESILLMLILSFDRLLLIILGPKYIIKITKKFAVIEIVISWIVSFLVYSPAIIGWDHWHGYSTVEHMDCDVEFAYNFAYTTSTAIVEFILPFILLTFLNTVIYYKIRKRNRVAPPNPGLPRTINVRAVSHAKVVNGDSRQENGHNIATSSFLNVPANRNSVRRSIGDNAIHKKDNKAARLLAILVAAFLIFWAPYTITTIIISFCDECVNVSLYEFFNWVLWMKSAVNPFLYAFNSVQYKSNFRKLLTCNRRARPETTETSNNRTGTSVLQK